jgi:hypothetical protein
MIYKKLFLIIIILVLLILFYFLNIILKDNTYNNSLNNYKLKKKLF